MRSGRGKTTVATLMALFAGSTPEEVRRSVQHGHPQLALADLLGGPLRGVLVEARESSEVRVSWRGWITPAGQDYRRVQSDPDQVAVRKLLSLMAEGYAEMYEQVVHCGPSAWFLTANDDGGGGTFPVIERSRIASTWLSEGPRSTPRDSTRPVDRVVAARSPEESVPAELVFSPAELDEANRQARAVPVPAEVRDAAGFLLGQLDFCRRASDRTEAQDQGHTAPSPGAGWVTCAMKTARWTSTSTSVPKPRTESRHARIKR